MHSWAMLYHILVGAVAWGSVPNLSLAIPLSESSQSLQSSISLSSSSLSSVASSNSASRTGTPSISIVSVSATPTQPSQPPPSTNSSTLADIQLVAERRKSFIVAGATADTIVGPVGAGNISAWLSTLGPDGKWPDSEIDYTTGCPARRANWPAQVHWIRIVTMTAAWHGGVPGGGQYVQSASLLSSISNAVNWWFQNDFTNPACLDSGGTNSCPCGTAGLWNTNWFSNLILIPNLVSQTCLLLNDTLTSDQHTACDRFTGRTFATLGTNVNGLGVPTGANLLDIAKIGIDKGLLDQDAPLIASAYSQIHDEVVIENANLADGIRADGSFGQHSGVLYNGNYGKDFANDVLFLEIQAGGTQFAAGDTSKSAFATLIDGDRWMMFRNVLTGVLHWDFSVIGRFITFPVGDAQASGSININITEIQELGQEWNNDVLVSTANSLTKNTSNANIGSIEGNRMFFNSDYMVQRGKGYVTTLKMYSTRSRNTECVNLANPLGFHLSDGTVYTYQEGDEYEDIASAWDWNLIPGITTDYGNTPLSCAQAGALGKGFFVGGASDGKVGAAAMTYTNPLTSALSWKKAWFFLENDVQHVMVPYINSSSTASVFSVLDQKRLQGPVLVNGRYVDGDKTSISRPLSLWHDNVGYIFDQVDPSVNLTIQVGTETGNWTAIGTSTAGPNTVDLFAAWLDQGVGPSSSFPALSYTTFPVVDSDTFVSKATNTRLRNIQNDAHASALYDEAHHTAMVVFWDPAGGSVQFFTESKTTVTVQANGNSVILFCLDTGAITVSDPSQRLANLGLNVTLTKFQGQPQTKGLAFTLPSGGLAGSSVTQTF